MMKTFTTSSGSLVVSNRISATCWQVLARTEFESRWGRISVVVLVACLAILVSDWLARTLSEQTQPTTR